MKRTFQILFLLFLIVGSVIIIRNNANPPFHTMSGNIFGTTYHIKYQHKDCLDTLLIAEMKRVDAALSMFNPESNVSKINAGATTIADTLTRRCILLAKSVNEETSGAFDVTIAPLVDLWGFGRKERGTVTQEEIDTLLQFVGMHKIRLCGDSILKNDNRTELDFSAIAKGLGVDVVAECLKREGSENFFIEIGGEVTASGTNDNGIPWTIGLENPLGGITAIISGQKISVATSGNNKNFYRHDGKKISHTIDPRTGAQTESDVLAVTVIAPTCAIADAYATAFMVLGVEQSQRVLSSDTTLAACFFVITDGDSIVTRQSDNFSRFLTQ